MTRVAFQTSMRAAAVELLEDYASQADVKLQVYRARPASIYPPCAFVDRIRGSFAFYGPTLMQQRPTVDVIVVHGLFDSGEAADQRDAFMDGFVAWVRDRYHQADANTLLAPASFEDDPNYIPDWLPLDAQRQFYATLISLEGQATDA